MKDFFRLRINGWGLLAAAGSFVCVLTVAAFLSRFWWAFDLTAHFRVQYLAGLLLLAAVFSFGRRFKTAAVFCACAMLNGALVLPYWFAGRAPVLTVGPTLRVLLMNVHAANRRHDLVTSFVRDSNPDLILLEEVNHEWMANLIELQTAYPYVCQEPREDDFGIALFSKLPLADAEIIHLGEAEVPSVTAEISFAGRTLRFLGTHPLPPSGSEGSRLRNQQLESIPGFLAAHRGPVILVGDLNTTPWSYHFKKLIRDTGLTDSGRGFGWQTTWPSDLFPLRIAIDHCLLTADLRVVSRTVGSNVGSDHLPLLLEIAAE